MVGKSHTKRPLAIDIKEAGKEVKRRRLDQKIGCLDENNTPSSGHIIGELSPRKTRQQRCRRLTSEK